MKIGAMTGTFSLRTSIQILPKFLLLSSVQDEDMCTRCLKKSCFVFQSRENWPTYF